MQTAVPHKGDDVLVPLGSQKAVAASSVANQKFTINQLVPGYLVQV